MRKSTLLLFIGLLFLFASISPTTATRLLAHAFTSDATTTNVPRLNVFPGYDVQQHNPNAQTPGPAAGPNFLTGPNAGVPLDIALQYIHQNVARLGLSEADLADLVVKDQYTTQHNGVTHLYLRQRYRGIEVYNADININISRNGEVINLGNRFVPALAQAINTDVPQLGPTDAVARVAQGLQLAITTPLQVLATRNDPTREVQLSGDGISADAIPVQLMYQPQPNGQVRLAWSTVIRPPGTTHWWHSRVDAVTGAVLAQNDWVDHEQWAPAVAQVAAQDTPAAQDTTTADAVITPPQPASPLAPPSYRIFALPLEHPNDGQGLPRSQTLVTNAADTVASPYGWHDIDGQPGHEFADTQGNNVAAQEDTDADDMGGFRPTGKKPARFNFDYAFDPQQEPIGGVNQSVAVVNLFYWNNIIHDLFYHYGFDEASGNFQENNYGHEGLGLDAVQADAQDGADINNANFGTPPDGLRPRMQMFNFDLTTPKRDSALDNGIVIHEYGHGISTRLTGGPANVGCLDNAEQMGEGWSDWFTLVLTAKAGDTGAKGRGVGTYVLGQPVDGPGIRRVRYSTDMNINPQTYNTIKESSEVHDVGEVWATMLWEMYWALVDQQGFDPNLYTGQGGNNLALQLVVDGLKLQPCSPGFVDGRDAILLADQVNHGGANQCTIWAAFAKRGLGASANQGSAASTFDGQAAFDLPVTCLDELLLTLSADPPTIQAGQVLTYSLVAGNYLSAALTNVVIQAAIPAETTYVPGSASDGGNEAGGVVSWPAVTLAPDQVITHTFQVLVNTTIPDMTTITNTANVTSQEGVTATATVHTVAIRAPDIVVTPAALEATVVGGDKVTQTLTISNLGTKPLAFMLAEFDGSNTLKAALAPSTAPTTNAQQGQTMGAYNTLPPVAHDLTGYQAKAGALAGGGGAARILLLAAADAFQLQTILQTYPDTNLVDLFDARLATPTLDNLLAYEVVVVLAGNTFADPVAAGDVLADYLDDGGKVIQTVPTFYDPEGVGWGLQGRFVTDGYSPLIGTGDWFLGADLGTFDATHPIMQGVTQANDYFRQLVEVAPGAQVIANWTDDEFVASKGSVVALNAYLADDYAWTGDVDLIVHNSIIWLQDQTAPDRVPWLTATPVTGTVESGASQTVAVTFDTAGAAITQAGDYYATLKVRSNDPDEPTVSVPITLHVVGPALTISDTQSYVGRTVDVPVVFNSNGLTVAATAFSVDYAEVCLRFDPIDSNNDGIPDAITINTPAGFTVYVKATTEDTDGELDFFIADTTPPFAALPDGVMASIKLTVTCQSGADDDAPLHIGFSSDPVASFSNVAGQNMPGRTQDGTITVLPGQLGDCNQDGIVNASDSISCVLELVDGDGDFWLDTPGGSFAGSPQGCDSNADGQINAADLICTVITIFAGPGQCAATVSAAAVDAPAASLSLPQGIAATAGEPLVVPLIFTGNGQRAAAAVFALRLDDPQLTFDPTDNNGDGIPDAVALSLPAGFATTVKFDAERNLLHFVLADLTPPFALLPDGPLATITLGVNPPTAGQTSTAAITFAVDTPASLGADNGQSAAVTTQDGSVQMNRVNQAELIHKLYLPSVLR